MVRKTDKSVELIFIVKVLVVIIETKIEIGLNIAW